MEATAVVLPPPLLWPLAAVVVGLVVVALYPVVAIPGHPEWSSHFPEEAYDRVHGYFNDWLFNVGWRLPMLRHNSLLYWVLLPVGLGALVYYVVEGWKQGADRPRQVAVVFLVGVVAASALNRITIRKYYDAPILLFLIWYARGEIFRDCLRQSLLTALILLLCAYFAVYPWTIKPGDEPAPAAPLPAPPL